MIINSLRLENFKSYSKTTIDFHTGISIIMGENGAGKSTILEAVSFALFKQYVSRNIQNLVRSGQKKMKVELEFSVAGRTYRVLRERGKSTSKAELRIKEGDGFQTISTGDKLVNLEIQSLLEMDGDLFLNAVYVRQGEIADLIEKTQSEKKQLIGKLLGIESLEKAWKNMAILIKDYEVKRENYKGRLESLEESQHKLKKNNEKRIEIQKKIEKTQSQLKEIIMELERIKKERDEMDQQYVIYNQIESQISMKSGLLNSAQGRKNELERELEKISTLEKRMLEIEPEIKRLADLNKLKDAISELNTLQNEKNGIKESLEKIDSFKNVLSENQPYFEEYVDIQKKMEDISQERSALAGSQELMKSKKINQVKLHDKIKSLKNELELLFNKYNAVLESEFDHWEDIEKQLQKIQNAVNLKMQSLEMEINEKRQQISSLEALNKSMKKPLQELESVEGQCPVCKSEIDANKKNELVTGYLEERDANKVSIKNLRESLDMLESQKKEMDSKTSLLSAINIDILKNKSETLQLSINELNEIEEEIENLKSSVSKWEELDANFSSKNSRLKEITVYYNDYIKAQGALDSAGDIQSHQDALKNIMASIYSKNEEISQLKESSFISSLDKEIIVNEISRLNALNNQYQQIKGSIEQKDALEETLKKVKSSIDENQQSIDTFTKSLQELPYDAESHQQLSSSFDAKNSEFLECNGNEKELNGLLKGVEEQIKQLEDDLSKFKKYESELSSLDDFIKLLNLFRDLYGKDGIQKELRNMSRPLIEQNTRDFFEKFNFDYSDIVLDEDYNIEVYGPVGKTSLDMISGGERIAIALALRLGITRALSGGNLELIMLDEPTIHLDTYRRQELIDIFKRMSILPQMIIVTHDVDLEEAADNIIKVEKTEGTSQVFLEST